MNQTVHQTAPLLASDEPSPATVLGCADPAYPLLLVCDHASSRIPASLQQLGLPVEALDEHIALDIGAADVVRRLQEKLQVPAVLANYSRLVVDCNRPLSHRHAFPDYSDNRPVPGNQNLTAEQKAERVQALFDPYHAAVASQLGELATDAVAPAVIAVHSFTPVMDGFQRPWHCGILWDKDDRLAVPLIESLRALKAYTIGDNEPYSGRHPEDYTLDTHAEAAGLPHVAIELRQDLIAHSAGAEQWAGILAAALKPLLSHDDLFRPLATSAAGAA